MLSLSVNKWGFTDKLLEINNLSRRRRVFTDKITFCETTIIRNIRGVHKKMRCATRTDATQNWIESNNLHVGFWCISLNVNEIE